MKENLIPPASLNQKRRNIKIFDKHNHHQIHSHTMMKIHSHTTLTSAGCAHTVDLTKNGHKILHQRAQCHRPPLRDRRSGTRQSRLNSRGLSGKERSTRSETTKPTSRRFAQSSGEIGRLKRSAEIGRPPLPNFVLQSLKTVPEQRVRQKTNRVRTTAVCFLLLVVCLHNACSRSTHFMIPAFSFARRRWQ